MPLYATRQGVNIGPAILFAALCLLGIGLVVALEGSGGPASRCETRGGHYLVGPAGETACIDRNTFLPMNIGEEAEKPL